ncbi:regulator of microtubule dynamics protein 1 [Aplysia californica]|uniref:Regulator of microtubule dynamics protein 1 n=1 Tax=Aplysia californica TaxID=6500 RepID=A0ABM0K6I1_APLCA|nr:regulator of microtubule dynamics protein 1 [Aplysia californica]XP_012944301.1 regulator of microtubule dynamics protein 1 [Aplysia californica]
MLDVLEKADDLYGSYEIEQLYEYLLEYKEVSNDEIQWRLARVTHDRAKHEKDKQKRQNSMLEAFSYAEKALELNSDSPHCHRWYGALLHFTTEGIGLKHKIQTAYKVREHFDKALELDPDDGISLHSIGYWCFVFAERPWYQRKLASALFESLPETTYDEALEWFLKAEEVKPNFMCTNCLMIAKTYNRLHNKEKALEFLKKTLEFKVRTPDDEESHKEAEEMLKHLGHGHLAHQLKELFHPHHHK